MIEISVTKADAAAANLETLTSGMVNAIFLHFTFSEEWSALSKVAIFTNGNTTIDLMEAEWASADTCVVPPEILAVPGKTVKVGLRGYSGDGSVVLPTTMCSLGSVKPGPAPSVDKAPPHTPAVWEQLQTQVSQLKKQKLPCFTTLEKTKATDTNQEAPLRIYLHGLEYYGDDLELWVFLCMRRRCRSSYWWHPNNWSDEPGKEVCKQGYANLAGRTFKNEDGDLDKTYPELPEWMPYGGYLRTVLPITREDRIRGYQELHLPLWLSPLLKPINNELDWTQCGLIGIQGDGTVAPLLFQFRIASQGKVIGSAENTLAVGIRKSFSDGKNILNARMEIKPEALYTSIR